MMECSYCFDVDKLEEVGPDGGSVRRGRCPRCSGMSRRVDLEADQKRGERRKTAMDAAVEAVEHAVFVQQQFTRAPTGVSSKPAAKGE